MKKKLFKALFLGFVILSAIIINKKENVKAESSV
jgi:hypothetical protein